MDKKITKLTEIIETAHKIAIIGHLNPDGDAVGAALALRAYLINKGKEACAIMPNQIRDNLKSLQNIETVLIYENCQKEVTSVIEDVDTIICVDFQSLSRTKNMEEILRKSNAKKILIDHHIDPIEQEFYLVFSDMKVSSTCELLFRILTLLQAVITKEIAEHIYTGIMTDTGSFSYSCNHKEVFDIVGKLMDYGIDARQLHVNVYDSNSESQIRMMGFALLERLKLIAEHEVAYIYLTESDLKKFSYKPGDTEGFVNYALSIAGVKVAALFTQNSDYVRISFRSKGKIDMNTFARENFNGGGHRNASGGQSFLSMEETLEKFENAVKLLNTEC